MNVDQPRIPNFCGPDSNAPQEGVYGFGCGHGTCAPEGTHCICEEGWAYSSYYFNHPSCWETTETRWAIALTLGILNVFTTIAALSLIPFVKRTMRKAAIVNAIGASFTLFQQVAFYFEGYLGLGSAFMSGGLAFGIMCSFGYIFAALFRPLLQISGINQNRAVILFYLQSIGASVSVFLAFFIPSIAALQGDWVAYNQRGILLNWFAIFIDTALLTIPCHLILRRFETTLANIQGNVNRGGGVSPNLNRGTGSPVPERNQMDKLVVSLRRIRNTLALTAPVYILLPIYVTICQYMYGQVPLQALQYFLLYITVTIMTAAISRFLYSLFHAGAGQDSSDNTRDSKSEPGANRSDINKTTNISSNQSPVSLAASPKTSPTKVLSAVSV